MDRTKVLEVLEYMVYGHRSQPTKYWNILGLFRFNGGDASSRRLSRVPVSDVTRSVTVSLRVRAEPEAGLSVPLR
eukprot:4838920-Prymnesium_polylepis.1